MWTRFTQGRPGDRACSRKNLLIYLFLAVLSILPLARSITHGFFITDDFPLLYLARSFEISSLFTSGFYHRFGNFGFIRPVGMLLWKLDYLLYGQNPAGYHLTSVLLNAACTLLLYRFALELTGHAVAALISAVIFAVSPCHVEPATWISGSYELLACAFYMVSFILYIRSRDRGFSGLYACSFAAGLLAILSKEMAITLPLALLVYELYMGKSGGTARRLVYVLPFFLLPALFFAIRLVVFQSLGGYSGPTGSAHSHIPTVSELGARLLIYLKTLTLGFDPSFPYHAYFAPLVAAVLLAGFVLSRAMSGNRKVAALALMLSLVAVLPVINFSIIEKDYMAGSRYLYLPSAFFSIFLGMLFTPPRGSRTWTGAVQVACALLLIGMHLVAGQDRERLFLGYFNNARSVLSQFDADVGQSGLHGLDAEIYNMPNALFGYGGNQGPEFSYALQYHYGYPGGSNTKVYIRTITGREVLTLSARPQAGYTRKLVFIYAPVAQKLVKVIDSRDNPAKEMEVLMQ